MGSSTKFDKLGKGLCCLHFSKAFFIPCLLFFRAEDGRVGGITNCTALQHVRKTDSAAHAHEGIFPA